MVIVTTIVALYYNMIIAWTIFYMFASVTSELPWERCHKEWSSKGKYSYHGNHIVTKGKYSYHGNGTIRSRAPRVSVVTMGTVKFNFQSFLGF